ncbi:hypothetical protein M8312_00160 [Sphingomonas sp. KRR8]|nr:hypothetical protein M8312_00160 [Sphingomonas sp. KRR8]
MLRALLVDEASRHLATLTVAEGPAALTAYDPAGLIEQAFLAAAAGLILVRGPLGMADLGLTPAEIAAALAVRRLGKPLNIHLLDCFAVATDPNQLYRRSTNHSFASSP